MFAVFRQFDASRSQAFPEDLIAGWVPAYESEQVEQWVYEMNNLIRTYPLSHGQIDDSEAVR